MSRKAMAAAPDAPAKVRKLRCAVYTRKSTDEGLEKEFNSLDAQRESCEAYIASQRPEGWVLVHDRYDDGGVSGGTLDRPALKRLLADIEAGLNAAAAIGDDRIQRRTTGYIVPESFTHGSSEQRMRWFRQGFDSGDMNRCNTFKAARL